MVLFGRNKELGHILALIRGPKESALTILGTQGSGKSSLLAEIAALDEYPTMLFRANAAEGEWPYSGLTGLLNGMDLPGMGSILEQAARHSAQEPAVSALTFLLLATLRQRPAGKMVVLIDDADELDSASQTVIGFLARRLAGTGLVLIATMRHEPPGSPFARLPSLNLPNLDRGATVSMLESLPASQSSRSVLYAVADTSQGNPLAAIELYAEFNRLQQRGQYALPVPLYWQGSFETALARSISNLSVTARRTLDLIALSYRSSLAVLEKMPGDLMVGVDELLAAGVAVQSGCHIRIQNPMLRGHVVSAMSAAQKSVDHQALAAHVENDDPLAWPWHLSFTAARRDTAFSLLRGAVELVRSGEIQCAAEYTERALAINPWEAETAARLGTLAEVLFNRGQFVLAKRYLKWAQRISRDRALTLRLTGLDFQIELMRGETVRPSMMLRLVEEFGQHDRMFSACLLSIGALHLAERWQFDDAERLLLQADQLQADASGEALAVNRRARLLIDAAKGNIERIPRAADGNGSSFPASLLIKGRALSYAENYDGARDLFALVRNVSAAGNAMRAEIARYFAADNEIRAGNFRAAIALIDEMAGSVAGEHFHCGLHSHLLLWRANAVGDDVDAKARLAEAKHYAASHPQPQVAAQLYACEGQFALMRGDLAEAGALLSRATELGLDFANPALLRCEADLIEVLVRSGNRHEAARVLTRLEYRSTGLKSRWLRTAVSRSRALVAEGASSLELFARALEPWQRDDSVFERARTLLCFAERLQSCGRPGEAKDSLLRARAFFEEIGAASWTQRVETLLFTDRIPRVPEIQNPALLLLTEHERDLVQLVARGRRNKEIAATLFVSVRTVEVRLTGIYRKLGVQSRSQLTSLLTMREQEPSRESLRLSV
jgi:DNA-binding CsgD family transcriptional regulator